MTERPIVFNYAKAGGPPDEWERLEVVDRETGDLISDVVEANADEGWFIRHVVDPETGEVVVEGEGDDRRIKTERVEQLITIRRKGED